ncbi:MAG: Fic family protein [Deltaproteobacteria bacterium]|nr:Fic family protein [Deltaproteobacteria bacterium]
MRKSTGYEPKYTVTAHLLRLLERIASLKTKIELSAVSVAWVPALAKEAFARAAHSSTAIEGNPLSLKEVQMLADGGELPHAKPKHIKEVTNYFAALKLITEHKNKKTISVEDVFKIHSVIGKDVLDRGPIGAYRDYQVYVGSRVPPKAKNVGRLMEDLLGWLNERGQALPTIFSSAILHYQFEHIHPFGDGNGRTGRLLALWELYRRRFDSHHIFSIDEVFLENRQRYYAALDLVRKEGEDITSWLEFSGEAVELTLERVLSRIEAVRVLEKMTITLSPKQERLLNVLQAGPLGIKEIHEQLDVTKQGAHFLLKPLVESGLIKRVGGHKTGKYILG